MANASLSKRLLTILGERWSAFFLIFMIIVFSLVAPNFFAVKNFSNILYFSTTYLLLAAGETFVIVSGGIDLSVGFVMGFVSVSSSIIMRVPGCSGRRPFFSPVIAARGLIPTLTINFPQIRSFM